MTFRNTLLAGAAILMAVPALAQTSTTPTSPASPTPSPMAPASPGMGTTTPGMSTTTPGTTMTTPSTTTPSDTTGSITGMFYSTPITADQHRASDLINQSVYNRNNERIGEVNELVLDKDGKVAAAIIGVGGFLGIGERNVAVNFNALQVTMDNNTTRVIVNADKAQLQQAPEFRRPDTWRRL